MPPWTMHRDARNFTFPESFWPERWLVAAGRLALADAPLPPSLSLSSADKAALVFVHNEQAFIPFSHGPMNCPGKGLAMLEMRTVACALLQRFRVRLRAGWDKARYEEGYKDYFSATRPELPVLLDPRW